MQVSAIASLLHLTIGSNACYYHHDINENNNHNNNNMKKNRHFGINSTSYKSNKNNNNEYYNHDYIKNRHSSHIEDDDEEENKNYIKNKDKTADIYGHHRLHQPLIGCISGIQVEDGGGEVGSGVSLYTIRRHDDGDEEEEEEEDSSDYDDGREEEEEEEDGKKQSDDDEEDGRRSVYRSSLVFQRYSKILNEKTCKSESTFNFCSAHPCFHGAECLEGGHGNQCDCRKTGFFGKDCSYCNSLSLFFPFYRLIYIQFKIYFVDSGKKLYYI